jgi:tetratricopeptide (TPR) repeat protein
MTITLTATLLAGCVTNTMLREQGRDAIARGDLAAAEDAFAKALDRQPGDYRALYQLGRVNLEQGQPLEAQLQLERAITLTEEAQGKDEDLPADLRSQILDALAQAYYDQQKYDRLTRYLADVAETTHDADDYLRLAQYQQRIGDIDAASVAYRKAALFAGTQRVEPYLEVAAFYRSIADKPNERIALRYAFHVDPQNEQVIRRLRELGIVPGPTAGLVPPRPDLSR